MRKARRQRGGRAIRPVPARPERIWEETGTCVFGMERLAARPFGIDHVGPLSPRRLSGEACQQLIKARRLMLPVACHPALFLRQSLVDLQSGGGFRDIIRDKPQSRLEDG